MRALILAVGASISLQPAVAAEKPFDRAVAAVQARMAAIDGIDHVIPGRAIVLVEAGRKPIINVRGVARVGGPPVTADTPFYVASMTKAFVGLAAVRLDEAGIMPLDTNLAEVFPDMQAKGVDLRAVTMQRLLNHQLGFSARPLNFRTAYTDRIGVLDYSRIVTASAEPADAAFQYSNLGYLLYAAALEKQTGRSWKGWLDELVLTPLGMRYSSARSSDLTAVAWGHERVGDAWRSLPPKRDVVMHAAGGLFVSAGDMARFLDAEAGGRSAVAKAIFAKAQGTIVAMSMSHGPVKCIGYSLGWMRCEAFGETFLNHVGEYAGQRSIMLIVPARRVGFAAMFNSDSVTGGLSQELALTFIANLAGKTEGLPDAAAFAETYRRNAERYRQNRTREEQEARDAKEWGGWQWKPAPAELADYAGRYRDPAYGEVAVSVGGAGLEARINGTDLALQPAMRDRFGARLASYEDLMPMLFERDGEGWVKAVTVGEFRFERARD